VFLLREPRQDDVHLLIRAAMDCSSRADLILCPVSCPDSLWPWFHYWCRWAAAGACRFAVLPRAPQKTVAPV